MSITPRAINGRSTKATAGSDFDDSDVTVTFDHNDVETEVCIAIYNNEIEEIGLESFSVKINRAERQQASSGLLATIDDENRETIVFIRDDDGKFIVTFYFITSCGHF